MIKIRQIPEAPAAPVADQANRFEQVRVKASNQRKKSLNDSAGDLLQRKNEDKNGSSGDDLP